MTDQVAMEFLKNRQSAILQQLGGISVPGGVIPGFLFSDPAAKEARASLQKAETQLKKVQVKAKKLIERPLDEDPVYAVAKTFFGHDDDSLNLKRPNDQRYQMRERAEKRWKLGYPPRKKNDTSIGDAINWEWIVECAKSKDRDIIIVSRDGDYGQTRNNQAFINDWLWHEFRDRVGDSRDVRLKVSLADALAAIGVDIKAEVVEGERADISEVEKYGARLLLDRSTVLQLTAALRQGINLPAPADIVAFQLALRKLVGRSESEADD